MIVPAVSFVGCWINTNWLAAAEVTGKELLIAGVSPALDAVSCFVPTRLMLKSLNVATPEALVSCAVVPPSVPVPVESVIVIDTQGDGTLFFSASRSLTVIAGVMIVPAVSLVGCWMNTNWLAAAGLIE